MAAKKFTDEQLSAINTTDKTLLVSAAAGAGKTSTLTERIVRSITRDENPDDISKMLIVTFTNLATDQLRGDIREAIERKLEENPENKTLEAQLTLLPMAKISTIDSFCNDILKRNSDKVGIPPNYRIADTAELRILSFSLLSKLIGELYENKRCDVMTSDEFIFLAEPLTASKSDSGLEEIFLKLYEKSKSAVRGVAIFKLLADRYKTLNPLDNEYTDFALKTLKNAALYCEKMTAEIGDELLGSDVEHDRKCGADFHENANIFHSLSLKSDYLSAKEALDSLKYKNLTSVGKGNEKTPLLEEKADLLSKKIKPEIASIKSAYFSYTEEEMQKLFWDSERFFALLAKFLSAFDELYMQEKLRRLALEYSDIERFAFNSLYKEDNETLTDFALSLKEEYSSVYIDEYQDVNPLQAKIFDAVSRIDNRFMVGDIKQSIYGFRSADPEVFASMKNSFPRLDSGANSSAFSIFMSQNFRSEKHIIDFVNSVFDKAFGLTKESIGYCPEDSLVFPEGKAVTEGKRAIVCLIPERPKNNGDGDAETDTENETEANAEDDEKEETPANELQYKFVAKKISELLKNDKNLEPRDIAIILRKRIKMPEYARALSELGIESKSVGDKDFFLNSEIQLALCLLNSIDNPEKDIYLAGLLASPLFSFTPDELLTISKSGKGSLYKKLVRYTEENSFEKGKKFIRELNFYRTLAEGLSIDTLILRLYNDTGLLELARRFGGEDNLLLLYDYAKNFSASSLKGLYNFIKFINNIIEGGTEFEIKRDGDDENAVNIISIHKSKGLQYKVVFYAETNALIKDKDLEDVIAFSEKFGISTRLRAVGGLAIVENPVHNVLNDYKKRRFIEEEFRDIYVALTRAVSELYVVGKVPEDYSDYLEKIKFKARHLNEHSIYRTNKSLELVLMTAENYKTIVVKELDEEIELDESYAPKKMEEKTDTAPALEENEDKTPPAEEEKEAVTALPDVFSLSKEELYARMSFKYKNEHLTKIPEKISVSQLKPRILDGSDEEDIAPPKTNGKRPDKKYKKKPSFAEDSRSDISAKKGIATHNFMQFFDVENFDKNGVDSELSRLTEAGFISKSDSALVEKAEIEKFHSSDFFREMKEAKEAYREFRFNTRFPAKYFNFDSEILAKISDEELLVQGVIDCILVDGKGELHLVDYKTDRLTKEELASRDATTKKLNESHAEQLSCYALAIEKIFGKMPKTVRVYSLPLGDTVDIRLLNFDKH